METACRVGEHSARLNGRLDVRARHHASNDGPDECSSTICATAAEPLLSAPIRRAHKKVSDCGEPDADRAGNTTGRSCDGAAFFRLLSRR